MAIRELPPDEGPSQPSRASLGWLAVLLVVALGGGAGGWLLRGIAGGDGDPELGAYPIGHVGDFAAGSLTQVELGVEFYDPYGVEADTANATGPGAREAVLLVINDPEDGVVAMWASSRWLGCRVVPVTRAEALNLATAAVPDWFTAGLFDPCHGGLFLSSGEQVTGPGERGLDRFPVGYEPDGTVVVDLTRPQRTGSVPAASSGVSSGGAATS